MFLVFTGAGHDRLGNAITRQDLAELAMAAGHTVQTGVTKDTDLLVASRNGVGYRAGEAAGNNAAFGRPMGGGASAPRLN